MAAKLSQDLKVLSQENITHEELQTLVQQNFASFFPDTDFTVYDMDGTRRYISTRNRAGYEHAILINNTMTDIEVEAEVKEHTVLGQPIPLEKVFEHVDLASTKRFEYKTDQGKVLGQYVPSEKQMNIYFDLLAQPKTFIELFFALVKETHEKEALKTSWYKGEVDTIKEQIDKLFQRDHKKEMKREKDRLLSFQEKMETYRRELANAIRNYTMTNQKIMLLEKGGNHITDKIVEQLDLLKTVPKILDIKFENNMFYIYTDDLYIQHDKTDQRYHAGKYKIELNLQDNDVRFYNLTTTRRSHWGNGCHHPHVSNTGAACLGNVASTIAELSAEHEIYSLSIIAINFLESVNTDDVAGRNIFRWDEVDENNNIISTGKEHEMCDFCEEHDYPIIRVYREIDEDGDLYNYEYMCKSCAQEQGHYYSNYHDEYVHYQLKDSIEEGELEVIEL